MPRRWSPSRDTWQTMGRAPRGTRFQNAGWIEKNAQPPGSSGPKGTRKPRRWEPFERHRQHGRRSARSARRAGVCVEKNAQPPEPARAARDAKARWSPREDACHEVERSERNARRAARRSSGDAWPLGSACRKARPVRAVEPFDRRLPDRASGPYGDARRTGEWLARNAQPGRPACTARDAESGRLSPSRDPCQKSSDPQGTRALVPGSRRIRSRSAERAVRSAHGAALTSFERRFQPGRAVREDGHSERESGS